MKEYQGDIPFSHFLKHFFSKHKKYGSRDRKSIAGICYAYFRTAALWNNESPDEHDLFNSLFFCDQMKPDWLVDMPFVYAQRQGDTIDEKCRLLDVNLENLFRFGELLSEEIDAIKYAQSFLIQPFFYLRIRPGFQNQVKQKLRGNNIIFDIKEDVIKLENGISLGEMLKMNKEVVVQDSSSQRVFDFLLQSNLNQRHNCPIKVWDVCAASGGKSILLSDRLGVPVKLTVSDNRSSMLHNLKKRLSEAGISLNHAFVRDIAVSSGLSDSEKFDIIMCDVPCTGSGTWARTPEQHVYFHRKDIQQFVQKQIAIVQNAAKHLENGGLLIYITCSVFKKENEGICEMIQQEIGLTSLHQNYIKGYEAGADTMFVSVFTR